MERQVDSVFTHYLTKRSELSRSANNIALLYLPRSLGGVTSLVSPLSTRGSRSLANASSSLHRFLADRGLQCELRFSQRKFKPAKVAREALSVIQEIPDMVSEEANDTLITDLQDLEREGQTEVSGHHCTSCS